MFQRKRLLELALQALEIERAQVDTEIAGIQSEISPVLVPIPQHTPEPQKKKKRTISVEGRKRISEAMKRRHRLAKLAKRRAAK